MTQININKIQEKLAQARVEIGKVIVGQDHLVRCLQMALMCSGHVLLEGVPGLAKTTTILALGKVCRADFSRIQFTPDLLPSDLIGSQIFNPAKQEFWVKKGPIFAHFVLADEINRAPAKVQSALLEAMGERKVTIGEETFPLGNPFLVLATQNPIEQEGTFPLPEAQVDRFFMKVVLDYPSQEEEIEIMRRASTQDLDSLKEILSLKEIQQLPMLVSAVFVDDKIRKYITDLVFATRNPEHFGLKDLQGKLAFGASPRGSLNLLKGAQANAFLSGRDYVVPDDIKAVAMDILRHRVMPTFEAEAEDMSSEFIVQYILQNIVVP
ncbi:MAG TPA: MoxR family ATPase [Candidatus Gracilibacteria bacterium]